MFEKRSPPILKMKFLENLQEVIIVSENCELKLLRNEIFENIFWDQKQRDQKLSIGHY